MGGAWPAPALQPRAFCAPRCTSAVALRWRRRYTAVWVAGGTRAKRCPASTPGVAPAYSRHCLNLLLNVGSHRGPHSGKWGAGLWALLKTRARAFTGFSGLPVHLPVRSPEALCLATLSWGQHVSGHTPAPWVTWAVTQVSGKAVTQRTLGRQQSGAVWPSRILQTPLCSRP